MDESEDTATSVLSTGRNRALSAECPIRAKGIITRDLKLFGEGKMGFLKENEVILVARKKGDLVQHGGRRKDRRHSIAEF